MKLALTGKDIITFERLQKKELASILSEMVKQGYAKIDAEAQNHLSKTGYPNRIVLSVGTPKGKSK
jgi:hypothetical protein